LNILANYFDLQLPIIENFLPDENELEDREGMEKIREGEFLSFEIGKVDFYSFLISNLRKY